MSKSICSKDNFDSEIVNVFFEGLGFTPICKKCTLDIMFQKVLSCKRYAISEREDGFSSPQCSSRAWFFLSTKDGYLPCCRDCIDEEKTAVNYKLFTKKYGEVDICNQYAHYIHTLTRKQWNHMGMIDLRYRITHFIERHKNPESEWYYMDYNRRPVSSVG